jgi:hypothetical protein
VSRKIIKAPGGNKYHGDDGHHLTHAVADAGKIDLLQEGEASKAVCCSKSIKCLTDMAVLS